MRWLDGITDSMDIVWVDSRVGDGHAKCKGCTACARKCPVGAITGKVKEAHRIDPEKCIKCGACKAACKFGAVKGI